MYAVTASVVALLLHHFIEQPFLTMKERARETLVT
jgi:hypothetical protein